MGEGQQTHLSGGQQTAATHGSGPISKSAYPCPQRLRNCWGVDCGLGRSHRLVPLPGVTTRQRAGHPAGDKCAHKGRHTHSQHPESSKGPKSVRVSFEKQNNTSKSLDVPLQGLMCSAVPRAYAQKTLELHLRPPSQGSLVAPATLDLAVSAHTGPGPTAAGTFQAGGKFVEAAGELLKDPSPFLKPLQLAPKGGSEAPEGGRCGSLARLCKAGLGEGRCCGLFKREEGGNTVNPSTQTSPPPWLCGERYQ